MFRFKSISRALLLFVVFFLSNFFIQTEDDAWPTRDQQKKSTILCTEGLKKDRSENLVCEKVQRFKNQVVACIGDIKKRAEVDYQLSHKALTVQEKIRYLLHKKFGIEQVKLATLGVDEETVQINAMALPFPGGDVGNSNSGSNSENSKTVSHPVPKVTHYENDGERSFVDDFQVVLIMVYCTWKAVKFSYDYLSSKYDGIKKPQVLELKEESKLLQAEQSQIKLLAEQQEREKIDKDKEHNIEIARLEAKKLQEVQEEKDKIQKEEAKKRVEDEESTGTGIAIAIPVPVKPIALITTITKDSHVALDIASIAQGEKEELTDCQLLRQKLATALTIGSRLDLVVTLDRDLVCEEESVKKDSTENFDNDIRTHHLRSQGYYGTSVLIAPLTDLIKSASSSTGLFTASDYANKILNRPKYSEYKNLRDFVGIQTSEELDQKLKHAIERISQLPGMMQIVFPHQLAPMYPGFCETNTIVELYDIDNQHYLFVVPNNPRLPAYQFPFDEAERYKHAQQERVVDESDKKYNKQIEIAQKELTRLEKNHATIEKKLVKQGIVSREEQLPKNFDIARDSHGQALRNETGDYFNKNGEKCSWNVDKNRWELTDVKGNHRLYPVQESQLTSSTNFQASSVVQSEDKSVQSKDLSIDATPPQKPEILTSPIPEQKQPEGCNLPKHEAPKKETPGCGNSTPADKPMHTGHEPVEKIPEKKGGCGVPVRPVEKSLILEVKNDQGKLSSVDFEKGKSERDISHPHGKYRGSAKHHDNSPDGIGKAPRDGQGALDRSIEVKDSTQRVTIEDGKIVILKYEEDGIYHGYVIEDFHTIRDDNVKNALVNNGFVRTKKSGKIIK